MVKKRYLYALLLSIFLLLIGYFVFVSETAIYHTPTSQKTIEDPNQRITENPILSTTPQIQDASPVLPDNLAPQERTAYTLWTQAELAKKTDSHRFYKVSAEGQVLPDSASVWQCVYDDLTGLLWEVKLSDGSWQDYEHTYSWFQPSQTEIDQLALVAGSDATELPYVAERGKADGGSCYDIYCDSYHYATAFNAANICATDDWRLPYAHELGYLDHESQYYPDIDTHYFPNTAIAHYWSRTETPKISSLAWSVDFKDGFPYISEKRIPYRIRLVADALDLSSQITP
jgi:hypothetical protein